MEDKKVRVGIDENGILIIAGDPKSTVRKEGFISGFKAKLK